ncbi:site-specific integrase [Marinilabilia salmonicolor]|uniref:Site-specific recombinase XerD n=1 Tax=Marinilabilia salmonicolor TaxID=989 RepID=A0A368ULL7_9BACT|nr:site-specific integrase [Marinilabilia salmonicolor]RCW29688.1 site-specific recombinase XerD [Marinilabilia salmonicolor]
MEQQAKYKLVFNRRKKKLENGDKAPLELEIYFSRTERKYISTKIILEPEQWGTAGRYKDKVKPSHPNYISMNQYLHNMINDIQNFEYSLINNGRKFTKTVLEDFINNKNTPFDFITFLETEAENDEHMAYGTRKEWNYTINMFKEFCGENRCEFSDFNYEKVVAFDKMLRAKALKQNTIHKHHKNLLRFINIAIKRKYIKSEDNPYNDFSSKKVPGTRENISLEEVQRIEELEFPEVGFEQISYVRDLFIFSAYTGIRYSDLMALKEKNIESSEEGYTIRFKQAKVEYAKTTDVVLPLYLMFEGKPQKILKKLLAKRDGTSRIIKPIANQVVNRHLKAIAVMAKTRKAISFHVARHTFGTLLADITANPYLIMELMGHSDIKTSMIYIHQSELRLKKQLQNVKWN